MSLDEKIRPDGFERVILADEVKQFIKELLAFFEDDAYHTEIIEELAGKGLI